MNRIFRRGAAIVVAVILVGLATTAVLAQDELLGGKLRTGDTVTVAATETVDGDLYLLGGTVTVDGTIDGDLLAVGGTVTLSGSVTGDLLVAGGTLTLGGTVEGDARIAGGQLTMTGSVGEDAVVTGGQATLAGSADVGGDLIVAGGQVTVSGNVAGSVEGSAGTYSRTGTVGGTEHIVQAPEGGAETPAERVGDMVFDAIRHFVAVVLIGALLLWLAPGLLRSADGELRARPLRSLGWGFLAIVGCVVLLIAIVLVTILLAIVFGIAQLAALVGLDLVTGILSLSVVTFLIVVAVAFVADIVVGLALGRLVAPADAGGRWWELGLLVLGLAVVVIVTSLPLVGGVAKLAVVLFGLGALVWAAWRGWRGRGTGGEPVMAPAPAAPPEAAA